MESINLSKLFTVKVFNQLPVPYFRLSLPVDINTTVIKIVNYQNKIKISGDFFPKLTVPISSTNLFKYNKQNHFYKQISENKQNYSRGL